MKIICLVKPVPDVERFVYDYERNVLVRDNVHLVINPEDATALARALEIRQNDPDTTVETVTMAPKGAMPHLEDLLRRGVERATLISDPLYIGSDTYATSRILARFLEGQDFDLLFCGTHTLDGGTAHVPLQVAELLGLPGIAGINEIVADTGRAVVEAELELERAVERYEVPLPAVVAFAFAPQHKLLYISYANLNLEVGDRISVVGNGELGFEPHEVGVTGSLTWVRSVEVKTMDRKDTLLVRPDDEGIETVFRFLNERGLIRL
jgi:electron transfer flavoprotein beta subunit